KLSVFGQHLHFHRIRFSSHANELVHTIRKLHDHSGLATALDPGRCLAEPHGGGGKHGKNEAANEHDQPSMSPSGRSRPQQRLRAFSARERPAKATRKTKMPVSRWKLEV